MQNIETRVSATREAIYSILDDPANVGVALAGIADLLHGSGSLINLPPSSLSGPLFNKLVAHGFDADSGREVERRLGVTDPWSREYLRRFGSIRDRTVLGSELLQPAQLEADPWRDQLKAMDISDVAMMTFDIEDGHASMPVVATVHRPGSAPRFDAQSRALLEKVAPDLKRVLRVSGRTVAAGSQTLLSEAILDLHADGVIACRSDGRIAYANATAERMLQDGGVVTSAGGMLRFVQSELQDSLEAGLISAARMEVARDIVVPDEDGPSLVATLLPLPPVVSATHLGFADVVIYLRNINEHRKLEPAILREMFGLTAAEAETTILASSGQTATDLAAIRGVSPETLRSQLKAAHAKMGTSTRSEMVALVTRLQVTIGRL